MPIELTQKTSECETNQIEFDLFNFPCGETHVKLKNMEQYWWYPKDIPVDVLYEYDGDKSIVELIMVVNALGHAGYGIGRLTIPYVPFSRQDRINVVGEPFSLKVFCSIVNALYADEVVVYDPHSDVTPALISMCTVIPQEDILSPFFFGKQNFWLVSPDAGAVKKIYKLAKKRPPLGVLECGKKRDVTDGKITGITLPRNIDEVDPQSELIIVDDICDNGMSFFYLAKELQQHFNGKLRKITLMITHGFFNKGLDLFDGLIDEIYTRKGRIK